MDEIRQCRQRLSFYDRTILPLSCVLLGGISLIAMDHRVGHYFRTSELPDELEEFMDAAEHFGTPFGQLLGLFCVYAVSQWKDRRVFRIFLGACLAGLSANVFKLLIGRTRPRAFDFEHGTIYDSFVGWFMFGSGGSAVQGFPSAHTAAAFGFAAMLTWAYPTGERAFILLACFVGLHRITTTAHFPSDVCIGAAVGWSVAILFTGNTWVARKFDSMEGRGGKAEHVDEEQPNVRENE